MKVSGSDGMHSSGRFRTKTVRRNALRSRHRHLAIEPLELRTLLDASPIALSVPGEALGDLETTDDFDIYELSPGSGQHLIVQFDSADARDRNEIYIRHGALPDPTDPAGYDAAGKVVGMADQFVDIPLTQDGSYFVLVRCTYDYYSSSDSYTLRADTPLANLPAMTIGTEQEDTLGDYDFDIYQVTPGEGSHLIVQLNNVDSRDHTELYIRHEAVPDWTDPAKYDAAGKALGHADQVAEIPQAQAGVYFVLVRCTYDYFSGADEYAIRADTLETLPELQIGVQADDSLNAYDFDIYQVQPGADRHLIVQFDNADPEDRNELYIRQGTVPDWTDSSQYDAAGKAVGHADQVAEITQTQGDTYFVLARCIYDYSSGSDAYSLRADTLDTLPRLEIGVQENDSLGEYDFDIYQVQPGDDQHLIVQFDNADPEDRNELYIRQGAVPDWTDSSEYDAAGNVVGYADQVAEILQTQDDTYFVLVRCAYDYYSGSDAHALRADTLDTLPSLEVGVQMDDSLGEYDFDIYQISPGNDQHLIVQFDNTDSQDRNELYIRRGAIPAWTDSSEYDAAGTVVGHADQFAEITQTHDDTYFVLARCTYDYYSGDDTYSLRADTLDTLPRLEIGVEKADSLSAYDFDIYQVEPGDNHHLVVQFDNADPQDRNELYIRRGAVPDWTDSSEYDAAGKVVGQADQFAEITQTQDDTYFVLTRCTYDYYSGADAHTLRADTTATLPSLILGVDQPGELGSWDFDIYRLYVGAGRHLIVQLDGAEYSDRNELYIRRGAVPTPDDPSGYDAAGKELGHSDQYVEIADTDEGIYYVLARCTYDSGGSDAYTLRADVTPPWPGFGAAGDSLTDEYPLGVASTWVELLAAAKDVNFGPQLDWGAPRNEGYEYNWARLGATSATLLTEGQHTGLAQQIETGAVDYAVLAIGQNDFAPGTSAYQGIYSGSWPQSQIDAFAEGVFDNIEAALSTLAAPGGSLIMTNIIDFGLAPFTQLLYPSATSRERVTTVLEGLNNRLASLATQYGIPLVDTFQLAHDFIGTGSTAAQQIGQVNLQISTGLDPHNVFIDGIHPHTIVQGALGNVFLEAFSLGYGLDVSSLQFTEQELLAVAGIGDEYVSDSLTLAYSDYVILPNTVEPIDLGTLDFSQLEGLSVSAGDIWYQLTTTRHGQLTAIASAQSGTVVAALYDVTPVEPPLADSSGTTARLDHSVQAGETYLLKLSGDSGNVALTLANLVDVQGSEIQVFGTSQLDHFEFAPSGSYQVTINGVEYHFDDTQYETIVFNGGLGDDTAEFTGSPEPEVAHLFPDHGTFDGNGFLVTVNEVTAISAHGGGGYDSAFMYDSTGDDVFISRKGYAKLSGEGFATETFDFMTNYGYATTKDGGNDIAYMEDTDGKDKFKFDWPNPGQFFGKMYGGGIYYNRAKYFEQIFATLTDGKDTARLFDSDGNDTFYGQKDESRLVGTGFDVTVGGYDSLIAYASRGNDIAYLEDSSDDDMARARPHKIMLWGNDAVTPSYKITARKFDEYHFEATHEGIARAKLHDTALDDHVEVAGNTARLWLDRDGELDLLYEVIGFDWVRLYASSGDDTLAKNEPLEFDLVYDPAMWDEGP